MSNRQLEDLKIRTIESILDRLKDFLPDVLVIELSLAFAIRPSITMCCTVDKIIREYHSTEANEEKVTKLLEKLLQIHFAPKAISQTEKPTP
jgi:hypothetical protein